MEENDVKRFICVSAGGLYTNDKMGFFISLLTKVALQPILKNVYDDMRLMEKEILESQLNYTIVRPPRLTNKLLTKKYRIAINDNLVKLFSIARADLAHLIVNHIDDISTFKSIIEVGY